MYSDSIRLDSVRLLDKFPAHARALQAHHIQIVSQNAFNFGDSFGFIYFFFYFLFSNNLHTNIFTNVGKAQVVRVVISPDRLPVVFVLLYSSVHLLSPSLSLSGSPCLPHRLSRSTAIHVKLKLQQNSSAIAIAVVSVAFGVSILHCGTVAQLHCGTVALQTQSHSTLQPIIFIDLAAATKDAGGFS